MYPKMQKSPPPIVLEAILAFEKPRGVELAAAYKGFLLHSNGGVPLDNLTFPIIGMPLNPFGSIQLFFGISTATGHFSLEETYDLYVGGFPHGIVPIADNGGGDYVCLDLRNSTDRVTFWDKRHFWSTGEWRESDLYSVAPSFDAFLVSLKPRL
jgi:SMI1 / KNR4 family (SUKH-1)